MFIMAAAVVTVIIIMKTDLSLCSDFNSDCLELVFSRLRQSSSFPFNPRKVGRSPSQCLAHKFHLRYLCSFFVLCSRRRSLKTHTLEPAPPLLCAILKWSCYGFSQYPSFSGTEFYVQDT